MQGAAGRSNSLCHCCRRPAPAIHFGCACDRAHAWGAAAQLVLLAACRAGAPEAWDCVCGRARLGAPELPVLQVAITCRNMTVAPLAERVRAGQLGARLPALRTVDAEGLELAVRPLRSRPSLTASHLDARCEFFKHTC